MGRSSQLALLLTPALSFATLAVGLGVGSSGETTAAVVEGAPPGSDRLGLAWQIDVAREDRGVREIVPELPIRLHVKYKDIQRDVLARTTKEGAAETYVDLTGVAPGEAVDLEVRTDDAASKVLASGTAHVPSAPVRGPTQKGVLPALARSGNVKVDVAIEGGALAAELDTTVWVHAVLPSGQPVTKATTEIVSEDSLVLPPKATMCDPGWAALTVKARTMSAQAKIIVKTDTDEGTWTGVLPIRLGATVAFGTYDDGHLDRAKKFVTVMKRGNAETVAYVELDDESGRAWSATPTLKVTPEGNLVSILEVPAGLGPQPFWVVAGSEPHAAVTLANGTTATASLFGLAASSCKARAELTTTQATGFGRTIVLDGFGAARTRSSARRKRGLAIALGALFVGSVVEAILILRGARQGASVKASWITGKMGAVVIGVGLAVLGFAMLGAFVATH